jgi:hypothetical protein
MKHTLEDFRTRQDELLEMISDLKVMLNPDYLRIKPNAKTAYEMLCSLGEKMRNHLAEEDRGVYPPLLIHEDPKLKSLAWGFINGEKPLRKQFDAYYKRWLKDCDFNFSADFLRDSHELFDAIQDRVGREQNVLLPKLEESGVFRPSAFAS